MAWYRLYRPQLVADLAITPVREQLEAVLKTGKYAHAYLFAGSKGTGKTSTARILARILNEPANADLVIKGKGPLKEPGLEDPLLQRIAQGHSQVVLELDAASHRGIDDIRLLQEQVSVVPGEGLIRVVILDEVHMLTTEAFNALLKLLEEPPERVVFILATTELHKVPATVQSRCTIVRFRQATPEEVAVVLERIAKSEKITLKKEDIAKLAEVSQGSFRDAVKYFESIVQDGKVSEKLASQVWGEKTNVADLLKSVAKKDVAQTSAFFQKARENGENLNVIEQTLFAQLQSRLHRAIERQESPATVQHITELLSFLVNRVGGYEPIDGLKLELACLGWCQTGEASHEAKGSASEPKPKSKPAEKASAKPEKVEQAIAIEPEPEAIQLEEPAVTVEVVSAAVPTEIDLNFEAVQKTWPNLLLRTRTVSQPLEAILRGAKLTGLNGSTVELEIELSFHKEQLESTKYRTIFLQVLREKLHPQADFRCSLKKKVAPTLTENPGQTADDQLAKAVEDAILSMEGNLVYSDHSSQTTN